MRTIIQLIALFPLICYSQRAFVSEELHSPLGIPLNLSTMFGDICPNHLHMGLDFRTNGIEGVPIYAIRDGFISRIRISRSGYGKALYLSHPNGQTSVYAHCSIFSNQLDSLVSNWLIQRSENEIDTTLLAGAFTVKKGELIAFSGNSGSSTGPHLHFEIRETASEIALNPLAHGFNLIDESAPFIEAIKIVPTSVEGFALSNFGISVQPILYDSTNFELAPQISLSTATFSTAESFGILLKGGDRMKEKGGKFDLYETNLYFDTLLVFRSVMDSISFDHTRYVNDYCDYQAYRSNKAKWHKLFYSEGNPLFIYKVNKLAESVYKFSNKKTLVKIVVSDREQHSSTYCFWLLPYSNNIEKKALDSMNFYYPKQEILGAHSSFNYSISPYTLMQPVNKRHVLNPSIPLSKGVIFKTELPSKKPEKAFIRIDGKYSKSFTSDKTLNTETKTLGIPSLSWDTIAPKISPLSYQLSDTICSKKQLKWSISDQHSEISNYALYMNDSFIPIYYDMKNNAVSCSTNKILAGKYQIRLIVRDQLGNEAIHEKTLKIY
jgi:hypothetical protein